MNSSFDTFEDQEDPFANLGKSRFAKKPYLRDNNIQFNITNVDGPTDGKFGEELTLTIEYVDFESGDATVSLLNFPYLNAKKEVGARTKAILATQAGLEAGRRFDGYYLVGSGTGYMISKTPAK
jgi:hypothetical protein